MKVLVISLACFRKSWRQKFVFASQNGDIAFKFIVPHRWDYYFFPTAYERDASSLEIIPGRVTFAGRPGRHFYYTKLAETMREFRPDIIHIEHEPESLVTLQTIVFRNLFAPEAKIILRTSRTFHSQLKWPKIRAFMEKYIYGEIDCAFCVNQKSSGFLRQQGYKGPVKIHPNGVDPALFSPMDATTLRERLNLGDGLVIGYVGRLVKEKGVDILIKAMAEIEGDYKLLIVGEGPELFHLEQIAREKNINGRLIAVGRVKQEDVPQYMNCMNVLVLPSITTSHWEEYFGMVLTEALACGVPVIGSTCGEIPNLIGDERLVFKEGCVEELKKRLINLFENYEYWGKWSKGNIRRVKAEYSWEVLGNQIIDAYNEVLK